MAKTDIRSRAKEGERVKIGRLIRSQRAPVRLVRRVMMVKLPAEDKSALTIAKEPCEM